MEDSSQGCVLGGESCGDRLGGDEVPTVALSRIQVSKYATGGFQEDGLFMANHNELVGKFSNGKTAVANNRQIADGIAIAVQSANTEQNQLL